MLYATYIHYYEGIGIKYVHAFVGSLCVFFFFQAFQTDRENFNSRIFCRASRGDYGVEPRGRC